MALGKTPYSKALRPTDLTDAVRALREPVRALREKINSRTISRQLANNRRSNRATLT
jgi:hypothetical protein